MTYTILQLICGSRDLKRHLGEKLELLQISYMLELNSRSILIMM
jgi:hypothetical protein